MPTLLFGRHVATEFPSGFNFVTSTFPGCFAGMLLGLKELFVLPLIFLVSCSMLYESFVLLAESIAPLVCW